MKKITQKNLTLLRSYTLMVFFVILMYQANAQPWLHFLPQNKTFEELTLSDYQQAFSAYMGPQNMENVLQQMNSNDQKEGEWTKFKRWEYYMQGVVDEQGHFPKQNGIQVVKEHKKTNPEVYANMQRVSNWSSLGPFHSTGGYAGIGRLNCIAFHPTNPDIWWVGAASGGLWATTNNGASWECLTDDNGVLAVSDIIIPTDYATSQTIYIATGDRDAGDNNSIGVLKSTDNGITWNETGITYTINQGRRIKRLLLDPSNNNTILAATSGGVFKTTNGGATWDNQLNTRDFWDLEYKPGDFNTLYGANGTGIWRTTDGGANWDQVLPVGQQRTELAVTPANPNVVYAVVSNHSSGLHGIYKSTNSGETFEQTFSGATKNLLNWCAWGAVSPHGHCNGDVGGQGWYDLCIAASPTNADIVLVGGVNTWRSEDGGYDWGENCINHWHGEGGLFPAVHADKHAMVYRNDGILFEGNDGGVYTSPNDGTTWEDKTNGMRISQMYKLGCSATNPGEIMTGLQDNGSKLFSGNDWRDVIGGDGMECLIDYSNTNIQYGTIYFGVIYRTTNHWNSASYVHPRDDGAWVTPYIMHPQDPKILYAGYGDLYKTVNWGGNWTKISNVNTNNKLKNIVICESDPDVIYMSDDTRIWRTTDGGDNWTRVFSLSTGYISSLCVKNDDPYTVWHTRGGYSTNVVYRSRNGGVDWENIAAGLPSIPMYSIVYNKLEGQSEQLYVGSEVGVYFKDGENDWVAFNNGLPNVKIGEIELYYDTQNTEACRLRAASYGRGLWESPIDVSTIPVAGTVTGNNQLCEHEVAQLFLIGFAGAVQWQQSPNDNTWTDIAGATTAFYQSEPLLENTYFRAKVTLGGTSVFSDGFLVTISSKPETPTISKMEDMLISDTEEGNQWYNQNGLIPGAIHKTFVPTENGTYFTIVTIEPCSSEPSNSIVIDDLSIGGNAMKDADFKIFPNPFEDQLTINNEQLIINNVRIVDVLGKEAVYINNNKANTTTINVSNLSAGVYLVKIDTNNGIFTTKIVKQ